MRHEIITEDKVWAVAWEYAKTCIQDHPTDSVDIRPMIEENTRFRVIRNIKEEGDDNYQPRPEKGQVSKEPER